MSTLKLAVSGMSIIYQRIASRMSRLSPPHVTHALPLQYPLLFDWLRILTPRGNVFLPPDYRSFISQAVEPVEYVSKKGLFLQLCDRHILIDGGKMSFGLERSRGLKCFMIAARELKIVWGEDECDWKWIPLSNSRFSEGMELLEACCLEIRAKIKCRVLSARTAYAAYLIFRMERGAGWLDTTLQNSSIIMNGMTVSKHLICLDPHTISRRRHARVRLVPWDAEKVKSDVKVPEDRDDGWKEIEMGRFYISDGNDEEVEVQLMKVRGGDPVSGLLLQGIEFRPLKDQSAFSFPTSNLDELIVDYDSPEEFFWLDENVFDQFNSYKFEHL